jgi:hypothetical protein
VAQKADGKVKEIKERVNKGIETSFQNVIRWANSYG